MRNDEGRAQCRPWDRAAQHVPVEDDCVQSRESAQRLHPAISLEVSGLELLAKQAADAAACTPKPGAI